jgi:hypothetical protein
VLLAHPALRALRELLVSTVQRVPSVRSDQREPTERPVLMAPRALLVQLARRAQPVLTARQERQERQAPRV